jgi:hypothetical protein
MNLHRQNRGYAEFEECEVDFSARAVPDCRPSNVIRKKNGRWFVDESKSSLG